jgi:uncharacterized membrane protein YdjX (TVP38/TMEM64 family)
VKTRLAILVALIVALAVAAALLPLGRIRDAVGALGPWAPSVAVVVGALLLGALVPRTAISIACGVLFGALVGGVIGLIGAMVAAVATFEIGRALGRDAVAARAGTRWGRLDAWLTRRGLLAVTVVRMMPLAPYGLVGYAYGTTSVRRRDYVLGTLIGGTPSAFTYAAVGAAVVRPGTIRWITFVPAGIGLIVTICAAIYWRRSGRGD